MPSIQFWSTAIRAANHVTGSSLWLARTRWNSRDGWARDPRAEVAEAASTLEPPSITEENSGITLLPTNAFFTILRM